MTTTNCDAAADLSTAVLDLAPAELQRRRSAGEVVRVVDVREGPEFAAARLPGSELVPLGQVARDAAGWDRNLPLVLVCRSGQRSSQARERLIALGFRSVACLRGGLGAWEAAGLPVERAARVPWSLERQVRIAAGVLVAAGVGLGFLVHSAFFALSGAVGVGLAVAGITDWCGMALLLARAPWNQRHSSGGCCGRQARA